MVAYHGHSSLNPELSQFIVPKLIWPSSGTFQHHHQLSTSEDTASCLLGRLDTHQRASLCGQLEFVSTTSLIEVHRHIQRRGSGPGVQPDERVVYLGGNVNHNADLSIEVDRRIRNAWFSLRKYALELYDRPSAPLELKIRMLRAEVLETMLYGCVTWSPRACHNDTLRRAHHRFWTRCIGWRKHIRADHLISYLNTLVKTASESIEATLRRRRVLFAGFVAGMEDTRLPKCVMFGEMVGGAGCVGGQEKEWMGCFLDGLRAFGINADQWTTAAPGQGEWRRTAEQGAEHFKAKWIAAEKTKAGLRHAVVCPKVTGRTKKRIA